MPTQLTATQRRHLTTCDGCAEVQERELLLAGLFTAATPKDDPVLQQRIIGSLPRRRLTTKLISLLPVVGSGLVGAAGAVLVGDLPGSSLLSLVPGVAGSGWSAVWHTFTDWGIVLLTSAQAVGGQLPTSTTILAGITTGIGGLALVALVNNLRSRVLWCRDS